MTPARILAHALASIRPLRDEPAPPQISAAVDIPDDHHGYFDELMKVRPHGKQRDA